MEKFQKKTKKNKNCLFTYAQIRLHAGTVRAGKKLGKGNRNVLRGAYKRKRFICLHAHAMKYTLTDPWPPGGGLKATTL